MKITQLDEKKRQELIRKRTEIEEKKQKDADAALRKRLNQKVANKYKNNSYGGFFGDRQTNIWLGIIAIALLISFLVKM